MWGVGDDDLDTAIGQNSGTLVGNSPKLEMAWLKFELHQSRNRSRPTEASAPAYPWVAGFRPGEYSYPSPPNCFLESAADVLLRMLQSLAAYSISQYTTTFQNQQLATPSPPFFLYPKRRRGWLAGYTSPEPTPPNMLSLAEIDRILEPPLSSDELETLVGDIVRRAFYTPENRYADEAAAERGRLDRLRIIDHFPQKAKEWLQPRGRLIGVQRRNIVTRHNIKRRWQKLGIWNPEWGIPGGNFDVIPQPNDEPMNWAWAGTGPDPPLHFTAGPYLESGVPNPDHLATIR